MYPAKQAGLSVRGARRLTVEKARTDKCNSNCLREKREGVRLESSSRELGRDRTGDARWHGASEDDARTFELCRHTIRSGSCRSMARGGFRLGHLLPWQYATLLTRCDDDEQGGRVGEDGDAAGEARRQHVLGEEQENDADQREDGRAPLHRGAERDEVGDRVLHVAALPAAVRRDTLADAKELGHLRPARDEGRKGPTATSPWETPHSLATWL